MWSVTPPSALLPHPGDEAPHPPAQRCPLVLQVSLLRLRLRKVALAPGEGVSRLFLKAQALLFGGYRDALVCGPVSFGDGEGETPWVPEGFRIRIPSVYGALTLCLRLLICKMGSQQYLPKRVA